MQKIFLFSGGKDSTASVILDHLYESTPDGGSEVVFSEVMYDKARDISGENIEHIDFIQNIAMPTFQDWGYKTKIIRGEKDYLSLFNHKIRKATKHPEHIGMTYGFPVFGLCSVKRDCKIVPVDNYLASKTEPFIKVLGIASDEKNRLNSLHKEPNKISLLEKYDYTEAMARDLCEKYGLLSPTYSLSERYPIVLPSGKREKSSRGGCWFCPNAKYCEHKQLKESKPELWKEWINLENTPNLAFDKWSCFNTSLKERDYKLKKEEELGHIV